MDAMRGEHHNVVMSLQQDLKSLQNDVQQLNFKMTTREVTESVDGFRDELLKLREQIAAVSQTCAEITATKQAIRDLEGRTVRTVASTATPQAYHDQDDTRNFYARFKYTVEVALSKLFPGGFGWQFAGNIADGCGLAANSAGFALVTGFGDAVGVAAGHTGWYVAKKFIFPHQDISIKDQAAAGALLGSAAMISGTIWQPCVNLCGTLGLHFGGTFLTTGAVCGTGFFIGLRVFRAMYCHFMPVPAPNYQNMIADAQLSVSIGGAAGTFTGTDPALAGNMYANIIGIQDSDSPFFGCVKAGSSTWIGFTKIQAVQNVFYPANRNWIDGAKMRVPDW